MRKRIIELTYVKCVSSQVHSYMGQIKEPSKQRQYFARNKIHNQPFDNIVLQRQDFLKFNLQKQIHVQHTNCV